MSATSKIIHTIATLGDQFSPTVMKAIVPSIKEWDAAIKQHNAEMAPFNTLIRDAEKALQPYIDALQVVGGAVAGAAVGITALASKYATQGVELDRMSEKYGVSVQWLSDVKMAADMNGVSMENLGTGMKRMGKNLEDALSGKNKDVAQYFKEMGISITDASGHLKSSDEIMMEVSDAFSKIEDGAYKDAAAIAIFGKSGDQLIPMLDHGSQYFKQWAQVSKDLGLEWSGNDVKASKDFDEAIVLLKSEMDALGKGLATDLMPLFKQLPTVFVWVESKAIDLARGFNSLYYAQTYVTEGFAILADPLHYKDTEKYWEDMRKKSLDLSDALDKESIKLRTVADDLANLGTTGAPKNEKLAHTKDNEAKDLKDQQKKIEDALKSFNDWEKASLADENKIERDAAKKQEDDLKAFNEWEKKALADRRKEWEEHNRAMKGIFDSGVHALVGSLEQSIAAHESAGPALVKAMGKWLGDELVKEGTQSLWAGISGEGRAAMYAADPITAALAPALGETSGALMGLGAAEIAAGIALGAASSGSSKSGGGGGGGGGSSHSATASSMASQSAASGAKTTVILNLGRLAERGNMITSPAQWTQMTINEMAKAMSRDPKINVKTARGN
jgi:Phage-related minor tail protein